MNDKKGQGLSINYIVIIAISLVVLVVIVLFFTGALKNMFPKTDIYQNVDSSTRQIWINQCELACQSGKANYCSLYFQIDKDVDKKIDEIYYCNQVTLQSVQEDVKRTFKLTESYSYPVNGEGPGVPIGFSSLKTKCAEITECSL